MSELTGQLGGRVLEVRQPILIETTDDEESDESTDQINTADAPEVQVPLASMPSSSSQTTKWVSPNQPTTKTKSGSIKKNQLSSLRSPIETNIVTLLGSSPSSSSSSSPSSSPSRQMTPESSSSESVEFKSSPPQPPIKKQSTSGRKKSTRKLDQRDSKDIAKQLIHQIGALVDSHNQFIETVKRGFEALARVSEQTKSPLFGRKGKVNLRHIHSALARNKITK